MTAPDDEQRALAERALRLHARYRGKVQIAAKCPVRDPSDFAIWYTPGVAAPCRAIAADPARSWELTNRGNAVAIVSDGSRILGLGDIGPVAGLPVMEGKSLLFKVLGGVDATPLCVRTSSEQQLVDLVCSLEPSFGAINLEDIAQPMCFRVLEALRERLTIPVWHDDQQGTATVVLAAVSNAMAVVGKSMLTARYALVGMGAANTSVYRLLRAAGVPAEAIVACDRRGILHRGRSDVAARRADYPHKWRVCAEADPALGEGGVAQALAGADICIAFSEPGTIPPAAIRTMATDPIVFACANPVPEIWPNLARQAGAAIVATGRSDFPNQVNNALGFPGIFRGILDVRGRALAEAAERAAADALARYASRGGLGPDRILPRLDEWRVVPEIAAAVAAATMAAGLAGITIDPDEVRVQATARIERARGDAERM